MDKRQVKIAQILKIKSMKCLTEKISINIVSGASYVYILSGQKLIKNVKNGQFGRIFERIKCDILSHFQTM